MKRAEDKRPRLVYITGTDGTGKSTQAELLAKHLGSGGLRCRRLWLRFPFFFSIPLLAYARWRGYSWHEVNVGVNHGYWDFSHSWLMRNLFPWMLFLDASLAAIGKIYLPIFFGETIICERFVLDMLVDLSIALQDRSLSDHLPGKLFLDLIPGDAKIAVLDLDKDTICSRRPNLIFDHALTSRLESYRFLASHLKLPLIDSHQSKSTVLQEILNLINIS
jgi:hypothetical protein